MSENIQAISQGNYILATQQEVSHDNTLSGNGTVDSPLGVNSDYIVTTEETIGTYNVTSSADTKVENTFVKAGYRPISIIVKFAFAGLINFNNELTQYKSDNSLYIMGYAHALRGSYNSLTFKAVVTWVKA